MELCLATVTDNFDVERSGTVKASISGDVEEKRVYLSSYYNTRGKGTLKVPVPINGSTIIVCKPKGSKTWIYLATCDANAWVGNSPNPNQVRNSSFTVGVDRGGATKGGNGFDSDLVIQNDLGCGLELSQTIGKVGNTIHTKLYTPSGKKITMSDTNVKDAISLDTGKGSYFALTGFPKSIPSPRQGSVLETVGSQRFINRNGTTAFNVIDGSEINFVNSSTGYNTLPQNRFKSGNINIQSNTNSVHILTRSGKSKVFIECLADTSLASSPTDNQIVIRSGPSTPGGPNKVIIEAAEVQITAGKISILSNNSVDIRSTGSLNLTGDSGINLKSNGPVNIDGTTINLNSNLAQEADVNNNTPGQPTNPYGPAGLFTPY
jgi:hypothetical protein